MPTVIKEPTVIPAHQNKPKIIKEFIGRVNTKTENMSLAHMHSPEGWQEVGQAPDFEEYTYMLKGKLHIKTKEETFVIGEGQAIITHAGEWVEYSAPEPGGAEYIAICIPAFSPDAANRDSD